MMNNSNIVELKVNNIFSDNGKYIIPIYQRNYSWKSTQIIQLIDDISDYAKESKGRKYYIGTLIVFEKNKNGTTLFDTIDGQQRLTTLFILLSVLKNEFNKKVNLKFNLDFESREISSVTLQAIFKNNYKETEKYQKLNTSIIQAYNDISKVLKKLETNKNLSVQDFSTYLLNNVIIIRIPVPDDTDLNHYFEIMNNRGEQLEKQEVLKAKMLNVIKDDYKLSITFNEIWEACSNMERYVQYGFPIKNREVIFSCDGCDDKYGWDNFNFFNIDDIVAALYDKQKHKKNYNKEYNKNELTIDEIIKSPIGIYTKEKINDDIPDRFTSPINFTNFLLQVLRIQFPKDDIPLDDKRLLIIFDHYLKIKPKQFVKTFIFNLLKMRFLFDKYVIKREYIKEQESWSLKKLLRRKNKNSYSGYYVNTFGSEDNEIENKNILMLLSMFHVSTPTLIYKHWLNAVLKFLIENKELSATEYISFLEKLAKTYLFDRFLAKNSIDYYEIIYKNNCEQKNNLKDIDLSILNKGTDVENFIFNYLDYLLWKNGTYRKYVKDNIDFYKYDNFEFSFRSSVEHFYPQNPIENIPKLDDEILNNFGNLCLISRSKNSRLSNLPPEAKKSYYIDNRIKDSIKQGIMMSFEKWYIKEIEEHGKEMIQLLLNKNFE